MGFADGFFKGRQLKLQAEQQKLQEKFADLKMKEFALKAGQLADAKAAEARLFKPPEFSNLSQSGALAALEEQASPPGVIQGPDAPQSATLPGLLAQKQMDRKRDLIKSGLLDEFKKFQEFQQGPTPFSPEGKEAGDLSFFARQFGPKSKEVQDLEARLAKSGTTAAKLSDVGSIRGQYLKESDNNITALSAFNKVKTLAQDASGAGDVGMIFAFMKLLDPGSRVTEGEVALAGEVSGAAAKFTNLYNRLVKGEKLDPLARQDIVFQAANIIKDTLRDQADINTAFGGLAQRNQIDPRDVVLHEDILARTSQGLEGISKPDRSLSETVKRAEAAMEAVKGGIAEVQEALTPDAVQALTPEELANIDLDSLSAEARAEAEKRIEAILGNLNR